MPIQKCKPTSPGRRFVEKVVHRHLHKGEPYAPLVESKKKTGGRNNNGHITTRHVGGGHKQKYRIIDFKRNKDGIPAVVERINTILTVLHTLHCLNMLMVSAVISLRLKA